MPNHGVADTPSRYAELQHLMSGQFFWSNNEFCSHLVVLVVSQILEVHCSISINQLKTE